MHKKEDMILWEVWDTLRHPDEQILYARKTRPIKWLGALLLFSLVGILQWLIWLLTIIPAKINKWVLDWRYI